MPLCPMTVVFGRSAIGKDGVFEYEENVIVAVKTVFAVDKTADFLRIGVFGRCNRSRDYLLNIHFSS
jgi:hypothetical protein